MINQIQFNKDIKETNNQKKSKYLDRYDDFSGGRSSFFFGVQNAFLLHFGKMLSIKQKFRTFT
jgi:hypothetical protein